MKKFKRGKKKNRFDDMVLQDQIKGTEDENTGNSIYQNEDEILGDYDIGVYEEE